MFDVIIPLRSGSRGIKNKNIIKFQSSNLVNYTLKKVINIKEINRIFILTNSIKYKKKILKNKKINLDYPRPNNLSGSNAKIFDLIKDFIFWSNKKKMNVNKIILLQVTSPLIKKKEIENTLKFIIKKKIDSLFHVTKMIEHPYECIFKKNSKKWSFLVKNNSVNRQNFNNKYYFINGSLFYFTKKFFLKHKKTFINKSTAYEVDKINFVDIDTLFDLHVAKKIVGLKTRN